MNIIWRGTIISIFIWASIFTVSGYFIGQWVEEQEQDAIEIEECICNDTIKT